MNIKIIIMDVDGTLTNSEKKISEKTKQALIKAQKIGVKLILASGRPTSALLDFAHELLMDQYHGLLVSYNGSKVIDCETGIVQFDQPMSIKQGKAVLEHMKQFDVIPMIDKNDYMYVNNVYNCMLQIDGKSYNVIEYESRGGKYKLCEIDDLAAFVNEPLNKILIAGNEIYLKNNYKKMMEPFKNELNCMFTTPFYFEFTAQNIDKAKALDSVLTPMGYKKEEIIAFGDGHNDISMLEYAGIGVAMGNAVDEVKQIANEITLSNEHDGIAETLYKYLPDIKI